MPIVADQVGGDIGAALKAFAANPADANAIAAIRADPEYIGQIGTTCVPTLGQGRPRRECAAAARHGEHQLPHLPRVPIEAVRAELEKVIADPAIKVKTDPDATASDASPLRPDVMAAVKKAVNARAPGLPIIPSMSAGATDSLHFRAVGVPSYGVAGLFSKASDSYAHGLNERVPVDAIALRSRIGTACCATCRNRGQTSAATARSTIATAASAPKLVESSDSSSHRPSTIAVSMIASRSASAAPHATSNSPSRAR